MYYERTGDLLNSDDDSTVVDIRQPFDNNPTIITQTALSQASVWRSAREQDTRRQERIRGVMAQWHIDNRPKSSNKKRSRITSLSALKSMPPTPLAMGEA